MKQVAALITVRREYGAGEIFPDEPIRTSFAFVEPGEVVRLGQPVILAEAITRFQVVLPRGVNALKLLDVLPIGSRVAVRFDATGLPPLSHATRRRLILSESSKALIDQLGSIFARELKNIDGVGRIVSRSDTGTRLEIDMAPAPSFVTALTEDEAKFLMWLDFTCGPLEGDGVSTCFFPLGPIGGSSKVALSMEALNSSQASAAQIDIDWAGLLAK